MGRKTSAGGSEWNVAGRIPTTVYGSPLRTIDWPKAVVLSNDAWRSHFGSATSLVGQSIVLSGDPYTVVGILPATFHSDPPADVFLPMQADPNSTNQGNYLLAAGRLKPGAVSWNPRRPTWWSQVSNSVTPNPKWMDTTESVTVIPLRDALVGDVRLALLILVGAVGFVLLIACANVANLLLARAAGRQREIAIRTAVGASRGHLIRQLLTESVLLSGMGGILGSAHRHLERAAALSRQPRQSATHPSGGSLQPPPSPLSIGMCWRSRSPSRSLPACSLDCCPRCESPSST